MKKLLQRYIFECLALLLIPGLLLLGQSQFSGGGGSGGAFSTLTGQLDPTTQIGTGSGAISLTAGGTNQNITLTPSGTGYALLPSLGTATSGNPSYNSFPIQLNSSYYNGGTSYSSNAIIQSITNSSSGQVGLVFYVNTTQSGNRGFFNFCATGNCGNNTNRFILFDPGTAIPLQLESGSNQWRVNPGSSGVAFSFVHGSGSQAQLTGTVPVSNFQTVTFSATPTFDASVYGVFKITLTGNVTSSTFSNAVAGESVKFIICQDSAGSHTFAWPSNVKGGMTIGSAASTCSAQSFVYDGTNAYATSSGVTNM